MSTEEKIQFKFPTVRTKLKNLFPFDPKFDIEIICKNYKYELQIAFLRLESGYFKNVNVNISKIIKIEEDFNEDHFEQIMKCFYGGVYHCSRNNIFEVWKIIEYLRIETFKKRLILDMKQNFQKYHFFELMAFAFTNNIEQIFTKCLSVLDHNNFMQLQQNKQQLITCPLELFKFLINTHNRRATNKKALSFIQVNSLLAEYCHKNQYSDLFYKELKFQLIQKTCLTAEQYRLIFIEGIKTQSATDISSTTVDRKTPVYNNQLLVESVQFISSKPINKQEKQHWLQKLQNLKNQFLKNKSDSKQLHSSVDSLSKSLKRKADEAVVKEKTLQRMESLVRQIQNQIYEKRQNLRKISQRIQKLQNQSLKVQERGTQQIMNEDQQHDVFVESHIIPGFCLGDLVKEMNNPKKQAIIKRAPVQHSGPTANTANFNKKKENKQDLQQYVYHKSLLFDKQPMSVPRRYLDSLAKLMENGSFIKRRQLNLLFRRSKNEKNNIGEPSIIRDRSSLLVLFQTCQKKFAGGFVSVQIPSFSQVQSLCDYQAFIFSLTYNVKMPIMRGEQRSAISLSKHYLLSFGNDLMISNDCLRQQSYCQWPGIYEVPHNSKCTSSSDLVGSDGQFLIEQIEIYEVKNEQIQMII